MAPAGSAKAKDEVTLRIGDRDVIVTHPSKLLIADAKVRKLDLVNYYVAVAEGALRGAGGRPCVLVRYPERHRRRVLLPEARAGQAARLARGGDDPLSRPAAAPKRSCRATPADLAWMANLACLELHPHPVRADDLDHPDELRVDLDPVPGVEWPQIREVARVVRECAGRLRARRLAQDLGLARHARAGAHRAPLDASTRCGARRWRWRARSSGARPASPPASGGRRSATASSSTTTRTRRTAPSPPPTRCGRSPTRASRRR